MNNLNNIYSKINISVYGVKFNFSSNSDFYTDEIVNDFDYFLPKSGRMRHYDFSITVHLAKDSSCFPINPSFIKHQSTTAQEIPDNRRFRIFNFQDEWFYIENGTDETIYLVSPEFTTGHIFTTREATEVYHATSDLLMNFLSLYLIRRNIFCVHAAALSKDNIGFLFPGRSGSGKTTISINLTLSGYKFLSDDYPLVKKNNSRFEILAFPQRLKVRQDTLMQFSELIEYTNQNKIEMVRPYIDISQVFNGCLAKNAEVSFLMFPNLTDSPKTSYNRISKNDALMKLIPCVFDPFSRFEPSIKRRKLMFEFAHKLVSQVECFDLFLSKNPNNIIECLERI